MNFFGNDRAAFDQVDLQLMFGVHGVTENIPGHGPAVLGVKDEYYSRAAAFIMDLDCNYGDQLAVEAYGYDEQWDFPSFIRAVKHEQIESVYLSDSEKEQISPDADKFVRDRVFEKMRLLQVLSPSDYAIYIAAALNIDIHFADASKDDLNAFWGGNQWQINPSRQPSKVKFEGYLRDAQAIQRLGEIASNMTLSSSGRQPVLAFLHGQDHKSMIVDILSDAGVTFDISSYSPDKPQTFLRDVVKVAVASNHLSNRIDEAARRRRWIRNARRAADVG